MIFLEKRKIQRTYLQLMQGYFCSFLIRMIFIISRFLHLLNSKNLHFFQTDIFILLLFSLSFKTILRAIILFILSLIPSDMFQKVQTASLA